MLSNSKFLDLYDFVNGFKTFDNLQKIIILKNLLNLKILKNLAVRSAV